MAHGARVWDIARDAGIPRVAVLDLLRDLIPSDSDSGTAWPPHLPTWSVPPDVRDELDDRIAALTPEARVRYAAAEAQRRARDGAEQDIAEGEYLTVKQAAARAGVAEATIRTWTHRGKLPPPIITSTGERYYRLTDLAVAEQSSRPKLDRRSLMSVPVSGLLDLAVDQCRLRGLDPAAELAAALDRMSPPPGSEALD